jgi:hypothetical protein
MNQLTKRPHMHESISEFYYKYCYKFNDYVKHVLYNLVEHRFLSKL